MIPFAATPRKPSRASAGFTCLKLWSKGLPASRWWSCLRWHAAENPMARWTIPARNGGFVGHPIGKPEKIWKNRRNLVWMGIIAWKIIHKSGIAGGHWVFRRLHSHEWGKDRTTNINKQQSFTFSTQLKWISRGLSNHKWKGGSRYQGPC